MALIDRIKHGATAQRFDPGCAEVGLCMRGIGLCVRSVKVK